MPLADPFLAEDAPDLAARDLDAVLAGYSGQGIQGPFHLTLGIGYGHLAGQFVGGLAGRRKLDQIENLAALLVGQPRLAASARFHPQALETVVIERLQAFAHRLRMAA
jgi:hypothetical protein